MLTHTGSLGMQVTSRSSKLRCSPILWTGKWSLDSGIPWPWSPRCLCDHLFYWTHVPGSFEPLCLLQAGPSAGRVFVPLLHFANCSSAFKPNGCSSVWSLPFPLPMNWSLFSSCQSRTLTVLPRQPHKLFDPICHTYWTMSSSRAGTMSGSLLIPQSLHM